MRLIKEICKLFFPTIKETLNSDEWLKVKRVPNWAYRSLINGWSGRGDPIQIITVKGRHFEYRLKTIYRGGQNESFIFYKRKKKKF